MYLGHSSHIIIIVHDNVIIIANRCRGVDCCTIGIIESHLSVCLLIRHIDHNCAPVIQGDGQGLLTGEGLQALQFPVGILFCDLNQVRVGELYGLDVIKFFIDLQFLEQIAQQDAAFTSDAVGVFVVCEVDGICKD